MGITIADVGAANFQLDERWSKYADTAELILFEPDSRSFEQLKAKGHSAYNVALGSGKKSGTFYLTKKPTCSSFLKPNMDYLNKFPDKERWNIIRQLEIDMISLDSLNLDLDFIQLDTQGYELQILKGAEDSLKNILGIELEVSFLEIYKNQPLFGEICNFLYQHGFEFYDFITEYRYGRMELNRKGQLAFADALFLKTPETVSKMTSEKITNYKIISEVYCKNDLIKVLENLQ